MRAMMCTVGVDESLKKEIVFAGECLMWDSNPDKTPQLLLLIITGWMYGILNMTHHLIINCSIIQPPKKWGRKG